jgi:hypothetical protein
MYLLAGSYCHVLRKTSAPPVALSKVVELSKLLKPAVIVLMGSNVEKAESLGRRFAYMRSNMTPSKISRTKSMAVMCYAPRVGWMCRIGVAVEQSSGRKGSFAVVARKSSQCRAADVVAKQAWMWCSVTNSKSRNNDFAQVGVGRACMGKTIVSEERSEAGE